MYDRACRKFKHNLPLWKEYMNFLCKTRCIQKLNRVVSSCVQIHPTVLDFWLIGVYSELDLKGNLFSSRNLMLQAIRNNENSAHFYTEYFRFETKFLSKIKQRKNILMGKSDDTLEFIDGMAEAKLRKTSALWTLPRTF